MWWTLEVGSRRCVWGGMGGGAPAPTAPTAQPRNPLHGITLEAILTTLVERHGWEALAQRINIRCFTNDPSIKSSLTFLRKTPWARQKVEAWYVYDLRRERPRSGGA